MISNLKRVELVFWSLAPGLIALLLFIACLVPKHMPGFSSFMPLLPLIPVFYWGLMQNGEMPYWFACALGLLADAATGLPLGISALLYLLFLATLHAQRKYIHKEGFVIHWAAFSLLLAGLCALQWGMLSFAASDVRALSPAFFQWLLTACCYPALHKLFDRLTQHIAFRRWKLIHA